MKGKTIKLTESKLRMALMALTESEVDEGWDGIDDIPGEDDIAKEALKKGFKYIAYHNSEDDSLTFFDFRTSGIHLGSRKAADDRGSIRDSDSYTRKYFIRLDNPYIIEKDFDWEKEQMMDWDGTEDSFDEWRVNYDPAYYLSQNGFDEMVYDDKGNVLYGKDLKEMLAEKGYDSIVYRNGYEDKGSYSVAMFYPCNIKLAENTYDDNGNPIPLEKRFDTSTDDVRY